MHFECSTLADNHVVDCLDTGYGNVYGRWLALNGRRFHASGLCRVYVLTENTGREARGFFTLSSHMILGEGLSRSQRGGVSASHGIPAQLLGKFALATDLQGGSVSRILMLEVFKAYARIASLTATRFLVLDVVNNKIADFYQSFGFTPITKTTATSNAVSGTEEDRMTMVLPTSAIFKTLE